ncbi:Trp biosynthesis-associated membrane protein [Naasia sp. SYSU D00948]|uniref:Trp biosynthesis-associated membrane protein n=1 Tax=Naasia sp. SYSU D00948 TaxID=2817379 RepID=UPI001B315E25|nr:Trp biosynthesis-associated membrane protein [Naasia sp. SYSU D00948]
MLAAAGILLVAANAPWFTVALRDDRGTVEVPGSAAAPALSGLALACIACVGAAALAPRVLRYVLAGVLAVLGAAAVLVPAAVLGDPLGAAEGSVSAVTGVSGRESVGALVGGIAATPWPGAALVAGAALVVLAVGMAVTASRWPASRRRYDAPERAAEADPWDAISRGTDPTREAGDGRAPLDSEP